MTEKHTPGPSYDIDGWRFLRQEKDGFYLHELNCKDETCACLNHRTWHDPVPIEDQAARVIIFLCKTRDFWKKKANERPDLLAEVERLREALQNARGDLQQVIDDWDNGHAPDMAGLTCSVETIDAALEKGA